jgi:hypothetical protein
MERRVGALAGILLVAQLVGGCALLGGRYSHSHWAYGVADDSPAERDDAAASWTAEPGDPDQELLDGATPACLDLAGDASGNRQLLIVDQRGPRAAALLWTDGDEAIYCLVARAADGSVRVHALGGSTSQTGQLATTDVTCEAPTLVTGTVPAGTDSLVVETRAGLAVTASVAGGRFLAWWPGRDDPVALRTETSIADLAQRWC